LALSPPLLTLAGSLNGGSVALIDDIPPGLHASNDMGLTIHYQLAATGDEANARKLVQQLRQAALDLPFQHVGEIVELQGDQCDWKRRADDDPFRWLLIQAGTHIALPVSPSEKRQGVTRALDVRPLHLYMANSQLRCPDYLIGLCLPCLCSRAK
jgi:hypothetical protein